MLSISHVLGPYGANRSLELLLSACRNIEKDLIIPREIRCRARTTRAIMRRLGPVVGSVRKRFLPFDLCHLGRPVERRLLARNMIRNIIWNITRNSCLREIRAGGYDLVHLNSAVLNPIISDDLPFIVHVREYLDGLSEDARKRLMQAKGLIFIDNATQSALSGPDMPPSVVINNPFDMTEIEKYSGERIMAELGLQKGSIVFSCFGRLNAEKGVSFLIRAFRRSAPANGVLLIAGAGDTGSKYEEECLAAAGKDARIRFLGEQEDILRLYAVTDYVLRGDPRHLVGRTVFEGLYAGCHVIIPGSSDDLMKDDGLRRFADKIHLYDPRSLLSLENVIGCSNGQVFNRIYGSNIKECSLKFIEFADSVLKGVSH